MEKMGAIPHVDGPARYTVNAFTGSAFVEMTDSGRFEIRMQYPVLGMQNAEKRCFVRTEVYDRLLKAAGLLPCGYRFRILDAWRPFALQHEIYEIYSARIIRDFHLEEKSRGEQEAVISGFVSDPVYDRECPPVHTTGGAVDLTIVDDTGEELDMGTGFDAFTDRTCTDYYENGGDEKIRGNRRLLYHVMTSAGFVNLPSEWWHFDYGDRFWGYYSQKPVMYEGVFTKGEINGGEYGER